MIKVSIQDNKSVVIKNTELQVLPLINDLLQIDDNTYLVSRITHTEDRIIIRVINPPKQTPVGDAKVY